jgi:hypothetical protein
VRADLISERLRLLESSAGPSLLEEIDKRERDRKTWAVGVRWEYERQDLVEIVQVSSGTEWTLSTGPSGHSFDVLGSSAWEVARSPLFVEYLQRNGDIGLAGCQISGEFSRGFPNESTPLTGLRPTKSVESRDERMSVRRSQRAWRPSLRNTEGTHFCLRRSIPWVPVLTAYRIGYIKGLDRRARISRRFRRGMQSQRGIRQGHRPRQRLGRGCQQQKAQDQESIGSLALGEEPERSMSGS